LVISITVAVTAVLSPPTFAATPSASEESVTLCHKPGTPAQKTLVLPSSAAKGHMKHGDTAGVCGVPRASAIIGPTGGQISIPGFGEVTFPAGAFAAPQQVTLSVTSSPDTAHDFEQTAFMFNAANRLPYELRINTGTVQPAVDFEVSFEVPAAFRASVPADDEVRVLGQSLWQGPNETLDTFELFGPRFTAADPVIKTTLPASLFTNGRTGDGSFEAIVLLATTPTKAAGAPLNAPASSSAGVEVPLPAPYDARVEWPATAPALAAVAGACQGGTLSPPLDGNIRSNSPFGPRDPNIGASPFHYGTDYPVPDETPVKSMADGVV
jgi:hypothetical protein